MTSLIYGVHPVKEALKSASVSIQKIMISAHIPSLPLRSIMDLAHQRGIPITYLERERLDRITKGGQHQGVIAILKETHYANLKEILNRPKQESTKALLLILDGIQDPQNLGSLIRTGLGCGVHGIIIPKDRAVGITPAVAKVSAGAVSHIPVARVTNIATTIDDLKKEGLWVYGASAEAKDRIFDLDLTIDLGIVIGGEGKGIRSLVKRKCDRLFSIPMKGPVSSFNAAVSGGMILYEVMRQRMLHRG